MCLVFLCCTGFLTSLIALTLSMNSLAVYGPINSFIKRLNQTSSDTPSEAAMYSASAVERDTELCLSERHVTIESPNVMQ